jgi:pSer/pThr/pTyr-binding forkhead associated (FHA) protein
MPTLIAERTDWRMDLAVGQRCHWLVGRDPSCELLLTDRGVSRFHATVFHIEGRFCVIDHSQNGTYLFGSEKEYGSAGAVPTPNPTDASGEDPDVVGFETCEVEALRFLTPKTPDGEGMLDLHRSHVELQLMTRRNQIPRMAGYQAHDIQSAGEMTPILEMIYSTGDSANLASMGRPVGAGNVLLFHGYDMHLFRFEE